MMLRSGSAPRLTLDGRCAYNSLQSLCEGTRMPLSKELVVAALRTVIDPELFKDIVTLNMVKDIQVDGDDVGVTVELTTPACPLKERIEADVTNALKKAG